MFLHSSDSSNPQSLYTPILIHYVPPVIVEDGLNPVMVKDPVYIKIEPPQGLLMPGIAQGLSGPIFLTVPHDGRLKLKLLPSHHYLSCGGDNTGDYIVSYFERGNRSPIDRQRWRVPPPLYGCIATVDVISDSLTGGVYLPRSPMYPLVFDVISTSYPGEFSFNQETYQIKWSPAPPDGQRISVVYQPALSLKDVLVSLHGEPFLTSRDTLSVNRLFF